jgi:hypothetical protein
MNYFCSTDTHESASSIIANVNACWEYENPFSMNNSHKVVIHMADTPDLLCHHMVGSCSTSKGSGYAA